MAKFITHGRFDNLTRKLNSMMSVNENVRSILDKYGREGVFLLSQATPVDTGLSRDSWGYYIITEKGKSKIVWTNSNHQGGAPVVILLQYGHMTGNGGYVQGIDFINPVMRDLYKRLSADIAREVSNL